MNTKSPTFETERLTLRSLSVKDIDLIVALNSDPEVMKHIGKPDDSYERAEEYVQKRVEQYKERPGFGIFVAQTKLTHEDIGWFCFKNLDDTEEIEIGYRLLKEFWGKGFATEGAKRLLKNGFENLKLEEIVGVTLPSNKASQHVLKKIGLKYEGRRYYYGHELCYFKMINPID